MSTTTMRTRRGRVQEVGVVNEPSGVGFADENTDVNAPVNRCAWFLLCPTSPERWTPMGFAFIGKRVGVLYREEAFRCLRPHGMVVGDFHATPIQTDTGCECHGRVLSGKEYMVLVSGMASRTPRLTRRSTRIGPLKHGELEVFGYKHVQGMSDAARHRSLSNAVRAYGALSVFRKLNAVYIFTRKSSPGSSRVFLTDRDWVRSRYMRFG